MRLTVNRASFLKALTIVNVAIGAKSPTPAFLNFKLTMSEDGLEILGSDNDLTIVHVLPIQEEDKTLIENYTEGSILITAKLLLELIRQLSEEKVTLETIDDVMVNIYDNKSNFKLNAMRSEEYPDLDLSTIGEEVTFKIEDFKKIISQTAFAASVKETRPILTAINAKSDGEVAEFVATDSYRLAKKTCSLSLHPFEANIPVKTLNEVSKLLEGEDVTLYISNNKVIFAFANTKVYSKLIMGDFPKTSRMIPASYPYVLKVNANEFINAMQRVSILAVDRDKVVKLSLDDNKVEIMSKNEQVGSANEQIQLFEYQGGRFDISFDVNYVVDAIKATQSEDVIISFAGEMSAFRVTTESDPTISQIITPVRSYY
jgi:DNA polymerase III subunit beta